MAQASSSDATKPSAYLCQGMCSWTQPALIASKKFFPPKCRTGIERLEHYARELPCVEIDSSSYAMPTKARVEQWQRVVPGNFIFHVKIFSLFTFHTCSFAALPWEARRAIDPSSVDDGTILENAHHHHARHGGKDDDLAWEAMEDASTTMGAAGSMELPSQARNVIWKDLSTEIQDLLWNRFKQALEPLRASNQMGLIVFQFQPNYAPTQEHLDYIVYCAKKLEPYMMTVEFRNREWYAASCPIPLIDTFRKHGIVLSMTDDDGVDHPPRGTIVSPDGNIASIHGSLVATHPTIAYGRIHRRSGPERLFAHSEVQAWAQATETVLQAMESMQPQQQEEGGEHAQQERRIYILTSTDAQDHTWKNIRAINERVKQRFIAKESLVAVLDWRQLQQRAPNAVAPSIKSMFAKMEPKPATVPAAPSSSSSHPVAAAVNKTPAETHPPSSSTSASSSSAAAASKAGTKRERAEEQPDGTPTKKVSKITSFFTKKT
jgi:uncharacterized protein YecE (DUF72 family)